MLIVFLANFGEKLLINLALLCFALPPSFSCCCSQSVAQNDDQERNDDDSDVFFVGFILRPLSGQLRANAAFWFRVE